MKDSFYTSSSLAEKLISHIDCREVTSVADFCVGGGELLRTAQSRWGNIEIFGTDISNDALIFLKKKHPDWNVEYCDFINEESRDNCKLLRNRKFDLILLNPPFTCKGSTIHKTKFEGIDYNVSTAMLFILESIKYMTPNGIMYAILPISVAYSQKDIKIWNTLEKKYNLAILEERDKQYFKDCYPPNIIIISINDFNIEKKTYVNNRFELGIKIEAVIRGQLSMNERIEDPNSNKYLIHSTNLKNNQIVDVTYKIKTNYPLISGPGVVIHRVGNPKPTKVCALKESESYVLSDCLIYLKTETQLDANELKTYIISNWSSFEKLYKGTGAKYITINRLKDFFNCWI